MTSSQHSSFELSNTKSFYSRFRGFIHSLITLGFLPGLLVQTDVNGATNSILPQEIEIHLRAQEKVFSTIHLEYRESLVGEGVPDYYGGPTKCSLYLEPNHFKLLTEYLYSSNKGKPTLHEDAYDGDVFYYGDPGKAGPSMPILKKFSPRDSTDPKGRTPLYFRYPSAIGFYIVEKVSELANYKGPETLATHFVSQGIPPTVEKVDGYIQVTFQVPDTLVLEAKATDLEKRREFLQSAYVNKPDWVEKQIDALRKMQNMQPHRIIKLLLSPQYGYSIVGRRELTAAGRRIVEVESSDWKHYEAGKIWLPSRCVESFYTDRYSLTGISEQPRLNVVHELTKVDFVEHKDVQFALNYNTPGTMIIDRTSPEARTNRLHEVALMVHQDGKELRRIAERAAPRRVGLMWICLSLVLLSIPPVLWWINARRK